MMADSREVTHSQTMMNPSEMEARRGIQDLNSNLEDAMRDGVKNGTDNIGPEGIARPEYTNMQGDPIVREAYMMPPAGIISPENMEQSPKRQYKMSSDIFGTGMDRTWTAAPGSIVGSVPQTYPPNPSPNPSSPNANNHQVYRNDPRSFKITEMSSNNPGDDEQAGTAPAGRRARESNGNPLTGHGFDPENAKTGKRYFEGSNANQKLW